MPETAEGLAAIQTSRRNVTIEISNKTHDCCLMEPKIYLNSGAIHSPPAPTVRPLKTELCNINKTAASTSGAVGVLTYDLTFRHNPHQKLRLAIMFSVPYDYNVYKNWFGLGIFNQDKECDEKLYKEMYYNEPCGFVRQEGNGCGLTFPRQPVEVRATMSPMGKSIMKVEVWDRT